jgi:hypothetical protein
MNLCQFRTILVGSGGLGLTQNWKLRILDPVKLWVTPECREVTKNVSWTGPSSVWDHVFYTTERYLVCTKVRFGGCFEGYLARKKRVPDEKNKNMHYGLKHLKTTSNFLSKTDQKLSQIWVRFGSDFGRVGTNLDEIWSDFGRIWSGFGWKLRIVVRNLQF